MDSGPSNNSSNTGPQIGAQIHDSQQTYNGYNNNNQINMQNNMQNMQGMTQSNMQNNMQMRNTNNNNMQNQNAPWINDSNEQMQMAGLTASDEVMDETDWDYLLSLGIGPSVTKDDPSGTALLRHSIANTSQAFDQQLINAEKVRAAKASRKGVIMIPPLMPRSRVNTNPDFDNVVVKQEECSPLEDGVKSDHEGDEKVKKRKKMKSIDPKDMTEEQLVERRERNREHAKKSRIRKRVLLDLLQDQLSALRGENVNLRRVVVDRLPHVASKVFEQCTTEESMLLIDDDDEISDDEDDEVRGEHILGDGNGNSVTISNSNSRRMRKERDRQRRNRILGSFQVHLRPHPDEVLANNVLQSQAEKDLSDPTVIKTEGDFMPIPMMPKQTARILMEPDFRLIEALIHSQQNFVLSDPSLPDNPIVYCSEGFCKLTGTYHDRLWVCVRCACDICVLFSDDIFVYLNMCVYVDGEIIPFFPLIFFSSLCLSLTLSFSLFLSLCLFSLSHLSLSQTGYKRQHILGRNCRFLQGPGTDQGAVDIIRKGVLEGCDISVCLLNYKADGSPFWNQFFVAALKDSAGEIINYVGVQCEVNTLPIEEIKDRVKRLPVPSL